MDGKEEQAPSRPNTRGRASGRAQSLERHFAQRDLLEQQSAALPAGELRQLRETIAREDRQPRHAASVTARRADATMGDLGRELLAHGIPASASAMRLPPAAPTAPAAVAATAAEPAELRSSARRRRAQRAQPPVPAPVFVTPARDVRFTLPVSETTDPSRGRLPAGADHGSMDDLFANAGYITPGGAPQCHHYRWLTAIATMYRIAMMVIPIMKLMSDRADQLVASAILSHPPSCR